MTKFPVIFRKDKIGNNSPIYNEHEIVAVFPTEQGTNDPSTMSCYAHIGQHSSCSIGWYQRTKPAKPEEYASLLSELKGYYENAHYGEPVQLVVHKRRPPYWYKA